MAETVRTRFAPSPTGFLHIGGLRTALYNFLFAKQQNGQMILRIEDTDRSRYVKGAAENLMQILKIIGIDYDEGPDKGGTVGPYIQSERIELYKKYAKILLDQKNAYYCFCSQERLQKMKEKQIRDKIQPKYDGYCRYLNEQQIQAKLKEYAAHVVRLKMPQKGETIFHDLIRGEVCFLNEFIDDQILIKSDGYPTYHLANVVDDHHMKITHIIRGEEWLQSVPKHLELYQALNWEAPLMAHLPLLLNPDRSKLSKRQGDVAVEAFLEKGYLPESLINFVALLGWNPGDNREIFTLSELMTEFSLERVNKSGAVFDIQKLNWLNGQYIRNMNEENRIRLLTRYLNNSGYDTSNIEKNKKIIDALYKKISRADEISNLASIFFKDTLEITDEDALKIINTTSALLVLETFLEKLKRLSQVDQNSFQNVMKHVQDDTGIKKQELWMPIRVALTGLTHGPDLPIIIDLFGKEKIQKFVMQTISQINR